MEPLVLDLAAPHQKYIGRNGTQYPGVTTVLGELAKPALYRWYAEQEREGILARALDFSRPTDYGVREVDIGSLVRNLPKTKAGKPLYFAEVKRDRAADLGTVVHERIRAWHLGTTLSPQGIPPEVYEQSEHGFLRFRAWWDEAGMMLSEAEYQMVDDGFGVGGTGDQFGVSVDGVREYWDTKTGKPWRDGIPYAEQIAQSAIYARMYERLTEKAVRVVRIARIGKERGDEGQLYTLSAEEREAGEELFMAALAVYRAKRRLAR